VADVKTLKLEITMDSKGAVKGVKGLEKAGDSLAKSVKENTKDMKQSWASTVTGINQGIELAKKAFNVLKGVFNLNKEFEQYKQGMEALARNTGQNADEIVNKLKEVSDGTVANKDLMLAANRAVALNVTKDVGQMTQLMEISRLKAKAMGIDTTQAFNDIVTGIGRGSPLILDNLGIVTKGWAEEAKAAGQAMDAQFILNKVLKDGAEELERAGDVGLTGAERLDKLGAVFDNLQIAIGGFLKSDAVKGFIDFATDTLEGVTAAIDSWSKFGKLLSKSDQQLLRTAETTDMSTEAVRNQFEAIVKNQKEIERATAELDLMEKSTGNVAKTSRTTH
jgi:methyl-accepting chemotaxis protein